MADTARAKMDSNQDDASSSHDSDVETTSKKPAGKGDKKNAPAPTTEGATSKIKPPAKKRVKADQVESKVEEPKSKKSKPISKAKKEKEEDEEESEEENGDSDKVPLLDQPLEVTGSRERKQVERFIPKELENKLKKEVEIPEGSGTALEELPRVKYQIDRFKQEDLKVLHRIMFNRIGHSTSIKATILKFNGFEFSKDSEEFKKKLVVLTKVKKEPLKIMCRALDLPVVGLHNELAERVLNFLIKPEDSGKEAPPGPRPQRKGTSSKSYKEAGEEGEDKKKGKGKNSPAKKKKEMEESDDNDDQQNGDEEEEEEENDDGKEDEDDDELKETNSVASEEEKPKKGRKKPAAAPAKKVAPAPAKKKAASAAKGATETAANNKAKAKDNGKKEKSEESEGSEQESENEKPVKEAKEAVKKSKAPPTDDEITSYVKSILDGADLKEITMNTVCSKVYEHYPDFDLSHKKKLIKNTVKSLIMS